MTRLVFLLCRPQVKYFAVVTLLFHQILFHLFLLSDVRGRERDSRSCSLNLPPGRRASWKQPWMLVRKGQLCFFQNLLLQFFGLKALNDWHITHSNSLNWVAGCASAVELVCWHNLYLYLLHIHWIFTENVSNSAVFSIL